MNCYLEWIVIDTDLTHHILYHQAVSIFDTAFEIMTIQYRKRKISSVKIRLTEQKQKHHI